MKTITIPDMPAWAICYLVEDDCTGMSNEEQLQVDEYITGLKMRLGWEWLSICVDSEEPHFAQYPEFGEATDCYECTAMGE